MTPATVQVEIRIKRTSMLHKCLKITQNVVAIEHLNIDIFHQFFVLLKVTCLVTLFN